MRRWRERFQKLGYDGLFDRRRGQPSVKRVPLAQAEQVLRLYRDRYHDLVIPHLRTFPQPKNCQAKNDAFTLTHSSERDYSSRPARCAPPQTDIMIVVVFSPRQYRFIAPEAPQSAEPNSLFRNILPITPYHSIFCPANFISNHRNSNKQKILPNRYTIFSGYICRPAASSNQHPF